MSRAEVGTAIESDLKLAEFILGADLQVGNGGDVDITSGELNLAQAILHRIRTSKGELAELGHPEYGSSILDFVGLENNWTTRQRLKLAIRDALRQEHRIKDIVSITVNPRLVAISANQNKDSSTKNARVLTSSSLGAEVDEESIDAKAATTHNRQATGSEDLVNTVDVDIVIIPEGQSHAIQLGFPFNLEGA